MIWLLPKIWRGIRMIWRKIRGKSDEPDIEPEPQPDIDTAETS